jgi:quercetin dioxygenase-like cupin family protein
MPRTLHGAGLLVRLVPLALVLSASWAVAGDSPPPGPVTTHRSEFLDAHRFDVEQLVLEFAPGTWTPLHTHGGMVYVTVLEGEMIVREAGAEEERFPAGASWTEAPGVFAEVGNVGSEAARILATFLLPRGAALTAVAHAGETGQTPPGPIVVHRSTFRDASAVGEFDVVHLVLEFAPGAWTPLHSHGGEAFVTVLEGALTLRGEDGDDTTYVAGEGWLEVPGEYAAVGNDGAAVGNDGAAVGTIAVTFVLPRGMPLTTLR